MSYAHPSSWLNAFDLLDLMISFDPSIFSSKMSLLL